MDETTKLWQRYKKHNDHAARDALILQYAPLVKYVVGRLGLKPPPSLEPDDLLSYGMVGLIEAVDRFDPSYDVKFETYAILRIKGQIIDSIRSMDILPRSVYRHAKEIEVAFGELSQSLGRLPTDGEVAAHMGITIQEYHRWLGNARWVVVSLDQPVIFSDGEQANLYDLLEDDSVKTPAELVDKKEIIKRIATALKQLPKREQLIVSLYYNDGLTMKEIGRVLEISESRVSQIHAKAVLMLRMLMSSQDGKKPVYRRRGAYVPTLATTG